MSKEYINRELLENALEDENKNGNFVFTANWIMEIVDNLPTADVVPKSEVEKWQDRCREWHEVAELKSNFIMELDEGLAKANAEIERLHGILLQFTDIVHKWGARNGIDTSEISLVPILQKEADDIVGKMEQEIETLKDSNEHLAVMLEEAKADVAGEIFEEIDDAIENLRGAFLRQRISELKKKYMGKDND